MKCANDFVTISLANDLQKFPRAGLLWELNMRCANDFVTISLADDLQITPIEIKTSLSVS